ncbi:MAG: amidohydrolase [Chloroflexi bacterium]|nr:amidohydrolase [Chloroflexota bacterium]
MPKWRAVGYTAVKLADEGDGTMVQVASTAPASKQQQLGIVDCDVHPYPRSVDEIREYMKEPWRSRFKLSDRGFYMNPIHAQRLDARPPQGGGVGTDPEFLREQLTDLYGIQYCVLLPRAFCTMYPDPDFASAIASAFNDWLMDTWLEKYNRDGTFKGSITVAHQDPVAAAREVERCAEHPHMVQVLMDSGARAPFGQRFYYPIYEACNRHELPVGVHLGTDGCGINHQPTVGYPSHYIEWHTCLPGAYMSHVVSVLTEGVFERFPRIKFVMTEGGSAWLAPLTWRLDAEYKALREEIPFVKRRPSEYLRDHVRFTSQPLESPEKPEWLLQIFEMMDAEHILMFASDYPHWDFDSPTHAFPQLTDHLYRRIFRENALETYGLKG